MNNGAEMRERFKCFLEINSAGSVLNEKPKLIQGQHSALASLKRQQYLNHGIIRSHGKKGDISGDMMHQVIQHTVGEAANYFSRQLQRLRYGPTHAYWYSPIYA